MSLYLPLPTNWHNSIENIRSLINCFDPAKNEQKKANPLSIKTKALTLQPLIRDISINSNH